MKRIWTIIGVDDVARSFGWYQQLFGQPPTSPAHDVLRDGQRAVRGVRLYRQLHPPGTTCSTSIEA
ncbi:VOC family protein [Paraburkholderia atlantica]|uniref:Uncharacterized protein n=1 Tax=Paraburkholderia atlantica TaxID=2654982 RepID=D5WB69_PARAM|nr:hypothetical protein [Paraburkholderia atlantica]ADG16374.1 hypothetical protein BC1002_2316 [Paraburkholderia atlantica]MBB5509006.1 hypothetical protein [Paraburkholderia atlantica]